MSAPSSAFTQLSRCSGALLLAASCIALNACSTSSFGSVHSKEASGPISKSFGGTTGSHDTSNASSGSSSSAATAGGTATSSAPGGGLTPNTGDVANRAASSAPLRPDSTTSGSTSSGSDTSSTGMTGTGTASPPRFDAPPVLPDSQLQPGSGQPGTRGAGTNNLQ